MQVMGVCLTSPNQVILYVIDENGNIMYRKSLSMSLSGGFTPCQQKGGGGSGGGGGNFGPSVKKPT